MRNLCGMVVLAVALTGAGAAESARWEYSDLSRIDVDGVSGDFVVRPADGDELILELEFNVSPEGSFRPDVRQSGDTLEVGEQWGGGSSSGRVTWTILVPRGSAPELRIETASGDLECENVAVKFDLDSASGDVRLSNVELKPGSKFDTASGDFELEDMTAARGSDFDTASGNIRLENVRIEEGSSFSTASGDVECNGCSGHLDLSSASGNVEVRDSQIDGRGKFSSASGDVSLSFDRLPPDGLSASSASGDVRLEVHDFGGDFTLVLIKRQDKGRIDCPFEYTSESTFEDHDIYERKVVERGSGSPEIEVRTASGRVTVTE